MRRLQRTERKAGLQALALAFLGAGLAASVAAAAPVTPQQTMNVPCGILTKFGGEVQIMDSTRTHLIDATPKAPVPCGGWISTGKGWVQIKHRDGFIVHLGSNSFAELPENNWDGKYSGDHVILYRGEAFGSADSGNGELRMITATARARTRTGNMILVFNHVDEETQLISIQGPSTLENRFEISRQVTVKAGEASNLNFKLLRVVPSNPRTVAMAALRAKLLNLNVDDQDQETAFRLARRRQARKFASRWTPEDEETNRKPAQTATAESVNVELAKHALRNPDDYVRHKPLKDTEETRKFWVNRLVAGQESAEKMLFPDKYYGRIQKVRVEVQDLEDTYTRKIRKVDQQEKQRLIDELSKIRDE